MAGVFLLHQFYDEVLDAVDHEGLLRAATVLNEGLDDSASIVLEDELPELVADRVDALLDELALLFVGLGEVFLLHHQFVVVNPQLFDQVANFLLLPPDLRS